MKVASDVLILNFGCSKDANLLDNPRLLIILGTLPLKPVLYLNSSLKRLISFSVSETEFGNASFSRLPDSISITEPFKSDLVNPSAVVLTIDSLIGDRTVFA